jgi:hypothetical protein
MEKWVYKTLPPDEAYWCTSERLTRWPSSICTSWTWRFLHRINPGNTQSVLCSKPLTGASGAGFSGISAHFCTPLTKSSLL